MAKPWQQALLSSGLPLENELRAYLSGKGCIVNFEYSYLKPDEHTVEREFSYDLDASYIKGGYFVDLMVECKYRYPGTKWIFAPDEYGGPDELYANDFLHVLDDFMDFKFPFNDRFPRKLAPLCSKAVELLPDGANEKAIAQALSQLAYAHAPRVASAIDHQLNRWLASDQIFCNVPIVATTAELYRLKEATRTEHIRSARELEDIAVREPCLVMKYSIGAELQRYNAGIFNAHAARIGVKKLKSGLRTYTRDLSHFYSVLARRKCPQAVVFVHVDSIQSGFEQLIGYIDEVIRPSAALKAEIEKEEQVFQELVASIPRAIKKQGKRRKIDA